MLPIHSRLTGIAACCAALTAALVAAQASAQSLTQIGPEPVVQHIRAATERMEMTVNTSRLISLDEKIPRAQVNNREILELTALSPNEIQVSAKKPGVTQVNLWNEEGKIYTIDVIVYGDARELAMLLQTEFPNASIRVRPLGNSVLLAGMSDRQDEVSQIIRLAEDYYPNVISHITVGGVQQVLLHVKVMEVSRTKLRTLGVDFAAFSGQDSLITSISGLISAAAATPMTAVDSFGQTVSFGFVDGNKAFFGFLDALRRYELLKILSEPTLVTVSGRPAFFQVGGEFPILVPQALGTVSIEYKKFGTQVDFVPIVLGNGNIRLEVRPRISDIDPTRSIVIGDTTVPGLRVREVDTGVEMRPGQTLALAGLVQTQLESENQGIPWLADVPYLGAAFRRVRERVNEVELLILVTPELVDAVDACSLPPCGPGMHTDSPNDCELYLRGYMEVPSCGPCGPDGGANCQPGAQGAWPGMNGAEMVPAPEIRQPSGVQSGPPGNSILNPAYPGGDPSARLHGARTAYNAYGRSDSPQVPPQPTGRYNPANATRGPQIPSSGSTGGLPAFIGPTGYDVSN